MASRRPRRADVPKLRLRGAGLAVALAVLSACAAANGQGTAPGEDVAAATASATNVPVAPLPGVRPSTVPPPAPFTAMTFNIQAYNTAVDAIRDAVLASGAAVVALQEYRAGTHAGLLAQLSARYPHQVTCLRGVVVLATFAPRDQGCVEIGDTQARDIAWMRVDGPGGPWTFASVHFSRPSFTTGLGQLLGAEEGAPEQAAQFEQLGTFVLDREQDSTVVVMGDFNAEPGWPHFGAFLERTGLATGPDLPTTRVLAGIGFAIDQVLVGPGAALASVRAGPDAGSDHLPVIAEIRPLPAGGTAQP
ncbi:MAG: endonuclease/exonuclease/phosphatase family protein [Rhodospirillaceae bacterium]|nr:endonuclease/exonuclease/phosphatase family protein [Rhodospirillaceae bacterium]